MSYSSSFSLKSSLRTSRAERLPDILLKGPSLVLIMDKDFFKERRVRMLLTGRSRIAFFSSSFFSPYKDLREVRFLRISSVLSSSKEY